MKKIIFILLFCLFSISLVLSMPKTMDELEDIKHDVTNYKDKSRDIFRNKNIKVNKRSKRDKEKILLLALEPINTDPSLADGVTQHLSYLISGYKIFQILDKTAESKRLSDYSEDFALKQANLAKVNFAIIGNITQLGEKYSITIQVINVEKEEIIFSMNEVADSQGDLFESVKKIANNISNNKEIMAKFRKGLEEILVLDFVVNGIDEIKGQEISNSIIYNLPDFDKYWSVDRNKILRTMKKLKIKSEDLNKPETIKKLADEMETKIVIYGKIDKSGEEITVDAKAINTESNEIFYRKLVLTKLEFQIPLIGETIAYTVSTDKPEINNELYDIDKEKYRRIVRKSKMTAIGLLSTGVSLASIGFISSAAGFACLGVYLNKYNSGDPSYSTFIKNAPLVTAILFILAVPSLITGLVMSFVSIVYFNRAKKYQRYIDEQEVSFKPMLEFTDNSYNLGLSMKF